MCNFHPFNAHIQIFSYVFLNFSQQILTFTKIHTGYPAQTALLKSHCRGGNAHSYACLRLFLRVVCFILDQTIVASDKCLSYARILLFPTGTQYPVGTHYTSILRGLDNKVTLPGDCHNTAKRCFAMT